MVDALLLTVRPLIFYEGEEVDRALVDGVFWPCTWGNKRVKGLAAYSFLAVGALGLALPLLPGIPLLLVGYAMLNKEDLRGRFSACDFYNHA